MEMQAANDSVEAATQTLNIRCSPYDFNEPITFQFNLNELFLLNDCLFEEAKRTSANGTVHLRQLMSVAY